MYVLISRNGNLESIHNALNFVAICWMRAPSFLILNSRCHFSGYQKSINTFWLAMFIQWFLWLWIIFNCTVVSSNVVYINQGQLIILIYVLRCAHDFAKNVTFFSPMFSFYWDIRLLELCNIIEWKTDS